MELLKLADHFSPDDVEWRIGRSGQKDSKPWATALAYLTNRAIQNRLDEVCGPENWQNEYKEWSVGDKHGVLCGISIYNEQHHEWITKWDGAENTDIESVKGGLSDSMKRAAVQWGIGRYLYKLDESFVDCSATKANGWNYAKGKNPDKSDFTFYWKTPSLPEWAVPASGKTTPAKKPATVAATTAAETPKAPDTKPTADQVIAYMAPCKTQADLDVILTQAMKRDWNTPDHAKITEAYERFSAKLTPAA